MPSGEATVWASNLRSRWEDLLVHGRDLPDDQLKALEQRPDWSWNPLPRRPHREGSRDCGRRDCAAWPDAQSMARCHRPVLRKQVICCTMYQMLSHVGADLRVIRERKPQFMGGVIHDPGDAAGPVHEAAAVSTGSLPSAEAVDDALSAAYARFRGDTSGRVADYIPALAEADPRLFGLSVADVHGSVRQAGDAGHPFSIQSISKAFVFALVDQALGHDTVRRRVGSTTPACRSTPSWPSNSITAAR